MAHYTNTADTATASDVVEVLNDLLENSRDGEYGFRACAEEVDSPHVKGTLGADSALSMLEECERGEDAAVARYRKALKEDLPADVRAVIQQQADGAQRNHDEIKRLRDQMRAAK